MNLYLRNRDLSWCAVRMCLQPPGEDVNDMFSPVSESTNVPAGMFEESAARMASQDLPMSPFSSINARPNMYPGPPKPNMPPMHPQMGLGHSRIYPPNQPMVFNSANPNAPPIYPCGVCHKEIHDNDQAILCESGCNFWFHRACTGLTDMAYLLLTKEVYAEWVCDKCLATRNIPLVKMKP